MPLNRRTFLLAGLGTGLAARAGPAAPAAAVAEEWVGRKKDDLPTPALLLDLDAFEANLKENHPDFTFYTSEHAEPHGDTFCHNGDYTPGEVHPSAAQGWRRWKFEYTGNARVPCWIVRVPKDIIWEHGGLWSDNSVAMLAALFRIEFPLVGGKISTPKPVAAPKSPALQ